MPSLRRTLSVPSVRPYPYSSATSAPPANLTRAGAHGPRRSSGSDTTNRRVLADIDWWRVQDGQYDQHDNSGDQDADAPSVVEREEGMATDGDGAVAVLGDGVGGMPPWQSGVASGADALEGASVVPPFFVDVTMESFRNAGLYESLSPLPQFSSLTISPRTPMRRNHSIQSSSSSIESTPDSFYDALFPAPTMENALVDMMADTCYPESPSAGMYARAAPLIGRSTSYSFVESELSVNRHRDSRFDDIVPAPPPYFSHTMMDVDDLFS